MADRILWLLFFHAACLAPAAVLIGNGSLARGDQKSADAKAAATAREGGPTKKDKLRPAPALTPERAAAVLAFVHLNHPELADLLLQLKENQPAEFDRAVRELSRTTDRLAQIRERDAAQYDLELAVWTAQSHIQLLAAKLRMDDSEELRKQLRSALLTQGDAKLALLKHERKKVADRLAKIDGDIGRYEKDRDQVIDRQLEALARTAGEGRKAKASTKNSAKQAKKTEAKP